MSQTEYHFGPTSSDYSGNATCCYCDGCGEEIGCLTPRRQAERTWEVEWQKGPAILCDRCIEDDDDQDTKGE